MPNAGLLAAAVLAQRIDLAALVDQRLKLAKHGANCGTKALTVIGAMLAGGDSIDDVAILRSGATGLLFDATRAPSTVGSWLRAHKWSNVRQLNAICRELLARLWAAGAGPDDLVAPLTIDLDSTLVEVHGRAKQGAAFGYTKVRGYHPQLATCAQTRAGADEPAARRVGRRGPRRRVVPDRDGQPSPRSRRDRAAHRPCRQRLLLQDGPGDRSEVRRPVLHHRPTGQADPGRNRRDRRIGVAADPVPAEHPGGLRRRHRRDGVHRLRQRQAPRPSGPPGRPPGRPPGPPDAGLAVGAVHRLGLSRLRHRPDPATGRGGGRPPSARHCRAEQSRASPSSRAPAWRTCRPATSWPTPPGSP